MKLRTAVGGTLTTLSLLLGTQLLAQSSSTVLNPSNPPAFQQYPAPVSSSLAFFASEQGKQFLLHAPSPIAKEFLLTYHGAEAAAEWDNTPHKYLTPGPPTPAPFRQQGNQLGGGIGFLPSPPRVPITGRGDKPDAPATRCAATRFNLEAAANAMPQNTESIDVNAGGGSTTAADDVGEVANDLRGFFLSPLVWSPSGIGYYFEANAGACTPAFEGGLPPVSNPRNSNDKLFGRSDPIINWDGPRSAWFVSGIFAGASNEGVGLLRNTDANLKSTTACPKGTHNFFVASACWPSGPAANGFNAVILDEQTPNGNNVPHADKPDSWVDPRPLTSCSVGGPFGCGDVYVTDTLFGFSNSVIDLWVCNNALTACSTSPFDISSASSLPNSGAQFSDIKTKADSTVTVTYGEFSTLITPSGFNLYVLDIKYVSCTPKGAPTLPSCNPPVLVAEDYHVIVAGLADLAQVRNNTYPVHVETKTATGTNGASYVFWENCGPLSDLPFGGNSVCPDADIVGSVNTGSGWSAPFSVDTTGGHQIQPWATYDAASDKLVIAYQNCNSTLTSRQGCEVGYREITSASTGSMTVSAFNALSAYANPQADPNAGFFPSAFGTIPALPLLGDYIGATIRPGPATATCPAPCAHLWVGFTDTSRVGSYGFGAANGMSNESNNNVVAVDNP
ncbi:MAG: hypothetical protein ACLQOO_31840 [Terriglobia bacterium]